MGIHFDDNVLKEFIRNFHISLKKEKIEIVKQRDIPYGIQFFLENHIGAILIVNVYNGKKD